MHVCPQKHRKILERMTITMQPVFSKLTRKAKLEVMMMRNGECMKQDFKSSSRNQKEECENVNGVNLNLLWKYYIGILSGGKY